MKTFKLSSFLNAPFGLADRLPNPPKGDLGVDYRLRRVEHRTLGINTIDAIYYPSVRDKIHGRTRIVGYPPGRGRSSEATLSSKKRGAIDILMGDKPKKIQKSNLPLIKSKPSKRSSHSRAGQQSHSEPGVDPAGELMPLPTDAETQQESDPVLTSAAATLTIHPTNNPADVEHNESPINVPTPEAKDLIFDDLDFDLANILSEAQ
ncbi:uncharacterized protein DS421_17g587630 [Arachis hypogaea]|nr:uncharacterized protein DS421_17g587630 [Arachis hypogaea]